MEFCKAVAGIDCQDVCRLLSAQLKADGQELLRLYQCLSADFGDPSRVQLYLKGDSPTTPQKEGGNGALDLPIWLSAASLRAGMKIMLISQDPGRRDPNTHPFFRSVPPPRWWVGTPFSLHLLGRAGGDATSIFAVTNRLYWPILEPLCERGGVLYLTDVFKTLPHASPSDARRLLSAEIALVNPELIVTWGAEAARAVRSLALGKCLRRFEPLTHPCGSANSKWVKLLAGRPCTDENKIDYFRERWAGLWMELGHGGAI